MSIEYAIIVKNKTRLETLIEQFNTRAQAKFYIERSGGNFSDYENEHEIFMQSLASLQSQLSKIIKHKIVDRTYLPSYIFSPKNIIVVIGQDGLVANTAKYANGIPIIAVNPDKKRYDGILLPFDTTNFIGGIESVLLGKFSVKKMSFAEAKLNDGQRLLAFNDLFIGISGHVSARYKITYNNTTEEHSSSGIIVSTPAGATGWLSSIFNMAYGIAGLSGKNNELKRPTLSREQLLFAVREPFLSVRTQADMFTGIVDNNHLLTIESLMPANGIIFSDGIEKDFINFNSGTTATIGLAKESATLVI
ncbi:NAD(+)/NADH kinase [Flavobacterium rhizosphaerae]|uniref:Sugar kinase n=1 Tax=Flavobacterium rhizosphaerae TaxID=3163298 RepID=A0ABW8YT64_9FLAO